MCIRSAWIVLQGARNACRTEQVTFKIGFEGGVGVDRSKMRREGVPSEADVLGCRCVAKMTNIEGKRYGENGEQW